MTRFYTRSSWLGEAGFGVKEIVDLWMIGLQQLLGQNVLGAMVRFYYDQNGPEERGRVVSSCTLVISALAWAICGLGLAFSGDLRGLMLGPGGTVPAAELDTILRLTLLLIPLQLSSLSGFYYLQIPEALGPLLHPADRQAVGRGGPELLVHRSPGVGRAGLPDQHVDRRGPDQPHPHRRHPLAPGPAGRPPHPAADPDLRRAPDPRGPVPVRPAPAGPAAVDRVHRAQPEPGDHRHLRPGLQDRIPGQRDAPRVVPPDLAALDLQPQGRRSPRGPGRPGEHLCRGRHRGPPPSA